MNRDELRAQVRERLRNSIMPMTAFPLEVVIESLEQLTPGPGNAPGTTLARILLDKDVAASYGLAVPQDERHHVAAWCLTFGELNGPKTKFYGYTLTDCFLKAVKELTK